MTILTPISRDVYAISDFLVGCIKFRTLLSEADIFYEYSIDGLIVRRKFLFLWFAQVFDVVMVLVCVSQPKCSSPSVRGAGIAVMQYYGTSFLG